METQNRIGINGNLKGCKFERLKPLFRSVRYETPTWFCECDCGNICLVKSAYLIYGETKSCGCLRRENSKKLMLKIRQNGFNGNYKHGKCNTRIYDIWCSMKQRCYDKNSQAYKDYGGRGIKMCESWYKDFQTFYDWSMANGYDDTLTIDRIDNDRGYAPWNCRWVTNKIQANNRRLRKDGINLTYNGKTLSLYKWSNILGIPYETLRSRYHRGWNTKQILGKR